MRHYPNVAVIRINQLIKYAYLEHLDLIKACKKNDYKAQMQLYKLYRDTLYNTSLRILKNEHDAKDAVHDSFIKGFQRIAQISDDGNIKAWLKRITVNRSLDILKERKTIRWLENSEAFEAEENEKEMGEEQYPPIAEVKKAIENLKDKYRIIIVLYLIEGYPHKEIAQLLGLNESTVRNQYRRGKQFLRAALEPKMKL